MYGLAPTYWFVLICEFVTGIASIGWGSSAFPLVQMAVPRAVQGRVMSLIFTVSPLILIGQLVAGAFADHVGPRWTLVIFGACALAMTLTAFFRGTLIREAAKVEFG